MSGLDGCGFPTGPGEISKEQSQWRKCGVLSNQSRTIMVIGAEPHSLGRSALVIDEQP